MQKFGEFAIDGRIYDFEFDSNSGFISCLDCGRITWCAHIEAMMKAYADAWVVWDKPENEMYPDILTLQVPMFPTSDLWVEIDLALLSLEIQVPRYAIEVRTPTPIAFSPLGFLSQGEGPIVIRSLLWEEMLSDPNRTKECTAAHHGPSAQLAFERRPNKGLDQWTIWTTGQCLFCLRGLEADLEDLIPAKEGY